MNLSLLDQLDQNRRKVDFNTFDITVKELISMVEENLIDVAPEYQRQFRWDSQHQSLFIESVFLGIPIPSMFMATNPDSTWEVVDGVQRLSTLIHFVGGEKALKKIGQQNALSLSGLEKLSTFNGLSYEQLPNPVQRQFLLKSLKVTTLSDKSDKQVRFDLFERLNRGGVILEPQEIRACVFRGEFNNFLREMAQIPGFKKLVPLTERNENNGFREELVLRFYSYLHNADKFEHSVVEFLNESMEEFAKQFGFKRNKQIFEATLKALLAALPSGITRGGRSVTPVNLFEAVSVGAGRAFVEKGKIITKGIKRWIKSSELKALTTGATNSRKMVSGRINYCYERFIGN